MVHVEIRYIDIKSVAAAGSFNIGTTLNIVERVLRPSVPQTPVGPPELGPPTGERPPLRPPGEIAPPARAPVHPPLPPKGGGAVEPPGGGIAPPAD